MRILPRRTVLSGPQANLRQASVLESSPSDISSTLPSYSSPLEALEAWRVSDESRQKIMVRWHPQQMPIPVYLAPCPDPSQLSAQSLLVQALAAWEEAGQGKLRFQQTSEADAVLKIDWTDTPTLGRDYEVGHTHRHIQGKGWITQASITLLCRPFIDEHLSPSQQQARLQATLLHELGHALGLEHAQHKTDVMYYRGWQNTRLTVRDVEALQALYATEAAFRINS